MATNNLFNQNQEQDLELSQTETNVTAEEIEWYLKMSNNLISISPILPRFLMSNNPYQKLFDEVSEKILTNQLPKHIGNKEKSIIQLQFGIDYDYWPQLFKHYLELTPTFIFYSDNKSREYLSTNAKDFWNFLYAPLQQQFSALIKDVIIRNYSPFEISINLFKK